MSRNAHFSQNKKAQQNESEKNDRIQKATAAEQAKPKCRICGKYTDKKTSPQCFGHGGGGVSESGGESEQKANKTTVNALPKTSSQMDTQKRKETTTTNNATARNADVVKQIEPESIIEFNTDTISKLLSDHLLTISNDKEKGILAIKLLCDPNLLSAEQKKEFEKFLNGILNELAQFKKENDISSNGFTVNRDKEGNILSLLITLPTPKLYDAFIQQLANKHLLPIQNIEQHANEKVVYEKGKNYFNPMPLSSKPTPSTNKKRLEEVHQTHEKKSSSIRPKSPLDGLKPNGWK